MDYDVYSGVQNDIRLFWLYLPHVRWLVVRLRLRQDRGSQQVDWNWNEQTAQSVLSPASGQM